MKKNHLILLSVITVVAVSLLAGCGDEKDSSKSTSAQVSETAAAEKTTTEAIPYETKEMTSNETIVSTDIFQVSRPEGWLAIRQYDTTQYSVNGIFPIDETKLCITKGGDDEDDAYTKPTVFIYYWDSTQDLDYFTKWYDDRTLLDDVTINGIQCEAAYGIMYSYTDTDEYYVYGIVIYPISENETIEFTVIVENPDGEGIALDDPDVMAIMNSVTLIS